MNIIIISVLCILAIVLPLSHIKSLSFIETATFILNCEGTILLIYAVSPQNQVTGRSLIERLQKWHEYFKDHMAMPVRFHLPILYIGFVCLLLANILPIILK
jgi:hypothetical protein